ncbi:MAG: DEAD/DEAH box helicase [Actinomycetota bacterium]
MTTTTPSFREFDVDDAVIEALAQRGAVAPFPIQAEVLPDATAGYDVLAKSQTGSGKTLGFAIPIVQRLTPDSPTPSALVLVPTRELAVQVAEEFEGIAGARGLQVALAYGGTRVNDQGKRAGSSQIVIATPGRLLDLAERRFIKLDSISTLVLDEADRMLDMGFQPQVDRIVRQLPKRRQTMFFSATLDGAVGRMASAYTRDARLHEIEAPKQTVEAADHRFIPVGTHDKVDALLEVLSGDDRKLALVFVRTKRGADRLVGKLKAKGLKVAALHGDLSQPVRERTLQQFEAGKIDVLIATDVAARGLDLDDISHVINFDPPEDDKGYVHRVGRTARAGRSGSGITLVTPEQQGDVSRVAARLDLHSEFEEEGMKVAPPRVVFSGSTRGRRSGLRKPTRRKF